MQVFDAFVLELDGENFVALLYCLMEVFIFAEWNGVFKTDELDFLHLALWEF